MQERVHGMFANVMRGCKCPELREAAQSHNWSGHQHYRKGVHTPVRFIFWNFNDIAGQSTFNLLGVRVEGKREENPALLAGALRLMLEASERLIGDAVKRSPDGAMEIMYIGGGHGCWKFPDGDC
eukprot:5888453-Pyramimonas_sp.AAC.1